MKWEHFLLEIVLIIVGANGERFSAAFTDSVHFVLMKSVFPFNI